MELPLWRETEAPLWRETEAPVCGQVAAEGAQLAEGDAGVLERKEKKKASRRRKTCERLPRLTVLEVGSWLSPFSSGIFQFSNHTSSHETRECHVLLCFS